MTADLSLLIGCPTCGVDPGSRCVTQSGRPTQAHVGRVMPASAAFWAGYEEGYRQANRDLVKRDRGQP